MKWERGVMGEGEELGQMDEYQILQGLAGLREGVRFILSARRSIWRQKHASLQRQGLTF